MRGFTENCKTSLRCELELSAHSPLEHLVMSMPEAMDMMHVLDASLK